MKRSLGACLGLAVLLAALLSGVIDLHSGPHPEAVGTSSVDLAATHAAETGHIETSEARGDLLCPACLVMLRTIASPRGASSHGAVLEVEAFVPVGETVVPLSGAACSTASRAPPLSAA